MANARFQNSPYEFLKLFPLVQLSIDLYSFAPVLSLLYSFDTNSTKRLLEAGATMRQVSSRTLRPLPHSGLGPGM